MALTTSSVESLPPSPQRVRVAAATGHVVGAHLAFGDDDPSRIGVRDGGFKARGHFGFLEPVEHQLGGQEHGDGIDLVLTGVFWRRGVCRFEHGVGVARVQILSARFTSAVE